MSALEDVPLTLLSSLPSELLRRCCASELLRRCCEDDMMCVRGVQVNFRQKLILSAVFVFTALCQTGLLD